MYAGRGAGGLDLPPLVGLAFVGVTKGFARVLPPLVGLAFVGRVEEAPAETAGFEDFLAGRPAETEGREAFLPGLPPVKGLDLVGRVEDFFVEESLLFLYMVWSF